MKTFHLKSTYQRKCGENCARRVDFDGGVRKFIEHWKRQFGTRAEGQPAERPGDAAAADAALQKQRVDGFETAAAALD
eukprot:7186648-Pyramimonas_sp.AAC.2